jgi:hypothetical protein
VVSKGIDRRHRERSSARSRAITRTSWQGGDGPSRFDRLRQVAVLRGRERTVERQARLRGDVPDVYRYNQIPPKLRAQLVHVLKDLLHDGNDRNLSTPTSSWRTRTSQLALSRIRRLRLSGKDYRARTVDFVLRAKSHENALDTIGCRSTAHRDPRTTQRCPSGKRGISSSRFHGMKPGSFDCRRNYHSRAACDRDSLAGSKER